jgi:superfamily II DNA or RNA helicase
VSLLRGTSWELDYDADTGDLARVFFAPALRCAMRYDRLTGYFTARSLTMAARGVEGLIVNGGRMRLIVGATLDEPEVKAIERGESLRDVVERAMLRLPDLGQDPSSIDALELLAWMIAHDHLAVKVAIRCDAKRRPVAGSAIFHEKLGLIEDKVGDEIAYTGSVNETVQGWTGNWEGFAVFTSWEDQRRVARYKEKFARLWADRADTVIVRDVPQAVRDQLLSFLPKDGTLPKALAAVGLSPPADGEGLPSIAPTPEPVGSSRDERRAEIWRFIAEAALDPVTGERVGEATSAVSPWPHQLAAFLRMYRNWPTKLLIADEVGLGKTIQAGLLLRQAWLSGRAKRILVLAPASVCRQWQLELREKFNLHWPIYDGSRMTWPTSPSRPLPREEAVGRDAWHAEPFVIMSSHLARRKDRWPELLQDAEPWDLVVVDEAHHARRRGAGSAQEGGPNNLLALLRGLRSRTQGLLLLTATPMQVHPVELFDLLDLLGLPEAWDREAFLRFFEALGRGEMTFPTIDRLSELFRTAEARYGETSVEDAERMTGLSRLRARRVLDALRDRSTIPRRQLDEAGRKGAVQIMMGASPVRRLVSRHTRDLLRRYHAEGRADLRIGRRQVEDRFVDLSPDERALYVEVERYISESWNAAATASAQERNAVGFVMTIYRRRLASSFYALRQTLEKRLAQAEDPQTPLLALDAAEDTADLAEIDEEIEPDGAAALERAALVIEECGDIAALLSSVGRLPTDTKAKEFVGVLQDLRRQGYGQAIVFTQFTDTLDFLRGHLAAQGAFRVMCFSGRGGEVPRGSEGWSQVSREEIKRRFRAGDADVLICTDAAAEGLNFQYCGALVNYDMPWNPMRVEQRIGRIDRLGQRFADIRIVNLHYNDTVESDVYRALRRRIRAFESVVGGLQPILSRLPRLIGDATLTARGVGAPADGAQAAERLEREIEGAADAVAIEDLTDQALVVPPSAPPSLTLATLENVLKDGLIPIGFDVKLLGDSDFMLGVPDIGRATRITVDRDLYDQHADSMEFWTQGNPTFPIKGI